MKRYTVEVTDAAMAAIHAQARYIAIEQAQPVNAQSWLGAVKLRKAATLASWTSTSASAKPAEWLGYRPFPENPKRANARRRAQ